MVAQTLSVMVTFPMQLFEILKYNDMRCGIWSLSAK